MERNEPTDLPSSEECLRRCELFASITNTDTALAMMYLQEAGWNLELSLSDYYGGVESASQYVARIAQAQYHPIQRHGFHKRPSSQSLPTQSIDGLTVSDHKDEKTVSDAGDTPLDIETTDLQHAHLFRLLSWNIDGMSMSSIEFRTPEVIKLIRREKFHIVCLQEVVGNTLTHITEQLGTLYNIFQPPDHQIRDYFPIICVLRHSGLSPVAETFKMTDFSGSVMGRILLSLDVILDAPRLLPTNPRAGQWGGQPIRVRIFTSHLESCFRFSQERKSQLSHIWNAMKSAVRSTSNSSNTPFCAILCGDLNVRDREISELGGLPTGMIDMWESCGARPEVKDTWDPRCNPNLELDNPELMYEPSSGFRFDRMMVLCNKTRGSSGLRPIDFELRGLERVPDRLHYPSDHWAILGHFDLENVSD